MRIRTRGHTGHRTAHPSAVETMKGPHDDVGTGMFAIASVDAIAGGSA